MINNLENKITLMILFFSILIIGYFNPMSEDFICSENYSCKLEKTYIFNIKKSKNIQLNNNSVLDFKTKFRRNNSVGRYFVLYPIIKMENKKFSIFTYYYIQNKREQACISEFNIKKRDFEKYIKNPRLGFHINSLSDGILAILWPIACLIGYPLWLFTNRNKKNDL